MSFFSPLTLEIPRSMSGCYRPAPKKIQFSSAVTRDIISQRAADVGELTGVPASRVFEDALTDKLLVHDEHARPYVNGVLLGQICMLDGSWKHYGIRDALGGIFELVSTGTDWRPARTNAKPLVTLGAKLIREHKPELVQAERYPSPLDELDYAFDSLCNVLEKAAKESDEPGLAAEAEKARKRIHPAILERGVSPEEIVDFILANWAAVKDSTHAFRVLHWLLEASSDWEDTARNRADFQSICETVMSEWTSEDKARAEERERQAESEDGDRLKRQALRYSMADGAYVTAPRDWAVLNPVAAASARYAGVMEVDKNEFYGAPHFLFFLDHPVSQMTPSEEEEMKRLATEIWPGMEKVLNEVVKLEYSSDGGVANKAEYSAAPHIGMFPILDSGEHPLNSPPCGAEIVRPGDDATNKESDLV